MRNKLTPPPTLIKTAIAFIPRNPKCKLLGADPPGLHPNLQGWLGGKCVYNLEKPPFQSYERLDDNARLYGERADRTKLL